jgi:curved DNA-binding protein CbpA
MNAYTLLGISADSSNNKIRRAFKSKVLKDFPSNGCEDSVSKFLELYTAYYILSDKDRKTLYDEKKVTSILKSQWKEEAEKMGLVQIENLKNYKEIIIENRYSSAGTINAEKAAMASLFLVIYGLFTIIKGLRLMSLSYNILGIVLIVVGGGIYFIGKKYEDNKYKEWVLEEVLTISSIIERKE